MPAYLAAPGKTASGLGALAVQRGTSLADLKSRMGTLATHSDDPLIVFISAGLGGG